MAGSLPNLVQIWNDFADLRDRFQIVAFHDTTVKDFEELDGKLKPVIEKYWKGKDLPFPILLDPSKQTLEAYGVRSYPTLVLINPDGVVMSGNAEAQLRKALENFREDG